MVRRLILTMTFLEVVISVGFCEFGGFSRVSLGFLGFFLLWNQCGKTIHSNHDILEGGGGGSGG